MSRFKDQMNEPELCLIIPFGRENSSKFEGMSHKEKDNLPHLQDGRTFEQMRST